MIAVVIGLSLGSLAYGNENFVVTELVLLFSMIGNLWLKALKCVVLPMIIFAMIDAMIMMRSLPGAKHVAYSIITWYSILPLCAGTQAIIYANIFVIPNVAPLTPSPVASP